MAAICVFVCVYGLAHKVEEGHNLQVSKYGLIPPTSRQTCRGHFRTWLVTNCRGKHEHTGQDDLLHSQLIPLAARSWPSLVPPGVQRALLLSVLGECWYRSCGLWIFMINWTRHAFLQSDWIAENPATGTTFWYYWRQTLPLNAKGRGSQTRCL